MQLAGAEALGDGEREDERREGDQHVEDALINASTQPPKYAASSERAADHEADDLVAAATSNASPGRRRGAGQEVVADLVGAERVTG